jgi:outer membrane protein TolC
MNVGDLSSLAVLAFAGAAPSLAAQNTDSLRLSVLHAAAAAADPRSAQFGLQAAASELRMRNIAAERLPALTANGQAQYQSDGTSFSPNIPPGSPLAGFAFPTPPHDTYDAHAEARQSLYDPTIAPRRAAERAQLALSQAQVRITLFGTRQEVDDAFFTALDLQMRTAQLDASAVDLRAHLRDAAAKLREGAALPGDTASLAASLLQREQDLAQARSDRHAAIARLSALVGRPISDDTPLALPDQNALAVLVASAAASIDTERARPEYAQFTASRESLARQEAVVAAQEKPRVSAFARGGVGRPGLNMLSSSVDSYWLAGVQVQWTPWTWGTVGRNREALELQRQIVATNEASFTSSLRRSVQPQLASIARLDTALALDERIVALREEVERETAAKLREGVITAAEYADRSTELLTAGLARSQHRIELARARATFLTTLGIEVP